MPPTQPVARCGSVRFDMPADLRFVGAKIFRQFLKASPMSYLSFRNQKIPRRYLVRFLPELKDFAEMFHSDTFEMWRAKMESYNEMVVRGKRMGLCPKNCSEYLTCSTLDNFMCRHYNAELAATLDSLCRFAKRVVSRIERKPSAQIWSVSGAMVITRQNWCEFCVNVETLIGLIGADDSQQGEDLSFRQSEPDHKLVCASTKRLTTLFQGAACF